MFEGVDAVEIGRVAADAGPAVVPGASGSVPVAQAIRLAKGQ